MRTKEKNCDIEGQKEFLKLSKLNVPGGLKTMVKLTKIDINSFIVDQLDDGPRSINIIKAYGFKLLITT